MDLTLVEKLKDATSTVTQISAMTEADRAEYIECLKQTYNDFHDVISPIISEPCLIMRKFKFVKRGYSRSLAESDIRSLSSSFAKSFADEHGYNYDNVHELVLTKNKYESAEVFGYYNTYSHYFYLLELK